MAMSPSNFRPMCLEGKVALITGGGSGIGKGIARKLMSFGCQTIILSRSLKRLEETARELEKLFAIPNSLRCLPVAADVRNYDSVSTAVDEALKTFGKIDILVNCAAGNFLCSVSDLSYKGFKTVMDIDAHGTFIASHILFHKILKYRGGVIINISMTLHYCGSLLQTHAGAAKAAIDAMTKHMAVEWGPYGIRVNAVSPGPIAGTEGVDRLFLGEKGGEGKKSMSTNNSSSFSSSTPNIDMVKFIPLQRMGKIDDVANVAMFLSLSESSYLTGANIVVDGGQWMTCGNFPLLYTPMRTRWLEAANDAREEGSEVLKEIDELYRKNKSTTKLKSKL